MANRRSLWLGGGLLLTLVATWYAAGVEDSGDELLAAPQRITPTARASAPNLPASPPVASTSPSATREPEAQRMAREGGDLFATLSWQPPPRAPELPYSYLGRMEEDGRVIAFLAEGAQKLPRVVRQGDLLPNYRVDEITAQGMRLTYLPLNETQRLLFGSTP